MRKPSKSGFTLVETLVLGASLDRLIPASAVRATAQACATEAVFLDELGHAMMLDHYWKDAALVIQDWLHVRGM